jgi:hypothetical protein
MSDYAQNRLAHELFVAEFPDSEVKSFNQAKPDQKPRWLSYVEDETVMDRLDTVVGPGCWNINVDVAASGVAKVTIGVKWPDNPEWTYYSDFGYPTNGERGETLKEAVSDGIRRTGRYLGIARYIYAGEVDASPSGRSPSPSAPAPSPRQASPRPAAAEEPDWVSGAMAEVDADTTCPKHNTRWYGDAEKGRYHKAGTNEDGKTIWCRHPEDEARRQAQRARR